MGPLPKIRLPGLFLLAALTGCSSGPSTRRPATDRPALVAFLVRHAEKVDSSPDPALSAKGLARAEALAHTLRAASIEHIHSSDFIRTRDTAKPLADRLGVQVQLYDPHDLPALVVEMRTAGGRHLVVGHSDTTWALAGLLGGDPGPPIEEAIEYDRLYVITVGRDDAAVSVLMRYGKPTGSQRGP